VWPGDPPWRYRLAAAIERGDAANVGEVGGTTHAGTHADAPLHVDPAGTAIDTLPLDAFAGRALLIDLSGREGEIERAEIEAELARAGGSAAGSAPERLLVATGCDWSAGFPSQWRGLGADAARWCGERKLRLVGTDAPSVDPPGSDGLEAHRALFREGIAIVESLALAGIGGGRYEFIAFPLRWTGADASPVRAALRRIEE
jgi:arylformamidase